MAADTQLTQRLAWKVLQGHYETVRALHMRNLFTEDPQRAERFSMEVLGIYLDYSKNRITGETIPLFIGGPGGVVRIANAYRSHVSW